MADAAAALEQRFPISVKFFDQPILAIESSCDETSAAVIIGRRVHSNVVSSQVELHKRWGGVVPEAASRAHVEAILPVIEEALQGAALSLEEIRGVAVTNRPGLVGALSVGLTAAKTLAFAFSIPLIGIHHLEGHILSPWSLETELPFPHLALVASGGHTELVWVEAPGHYTIVAQTLDDAAGEAFDKGGRLLGLGYPGGAAVAKVARTGNPQRYELPRGIDRDPNYFSYSGLKTAMMRLVEKEGSELHIPDAAASLQHTICSALTKKSEAHLERLGAKCMTLVGGVAANQELRNQIQAACSRHGATCQVPAPELCTDNAAMIGLAASFRLARGERDGWELDAYPNAPLPNLDSIQL